MATGVGATCWTYMIRRERAELSRFRGHEVKSLRHGFPVTLMARPGGDSLRTINSDRASAPEQYRFAPAFPLARSKSRGNDIRGHRSAHHIAGSEFLEAPTTSVVSRTIKDIVAGSGITFEDFGTHVLKGVPDDWQLYRVADLARADAAF